MGAKWMGLLDLLNLRRQKSPYFGGFVQNDLMDHLPQVVRVERVADRGFGTASD
jgi:hypothetical protein